MIRFAAFAMSAVAACTAVALASPASSQQVDNNGNLAALIAKHAAANNIPESLVRRIIHRESRGNARAISKGNYGLMQIRLGTARGLGYRGDARGLLDADTNMTYAVKYLAGAYRVAGGNEGRAVSYYAAGYYYAAKSRGLADKSGALKAYASAETPASVPAAAAEGNGPVESAGVPTPSREEDHTR
jgi:soluble lytic murein transglycosylase-like protein